jgi:hypothetical protein
VFGASRQSPRVAAPIPDGRGAALYLASRFSARKCGRRQYEASRLRSRTLKRPCSFEPGPDLETRAPLEVGTISTPHRAPVTSSESCRCGVLLAQSQTNGGNFVPAFLSVGQYITYALLGRFLPRLGPPATLAAPSLCPCARRKYLYLPNIDWTTLAE